jgi:hypothetical protein
LKSRQLDLLSATLVEPKRIATFSSPGGEDKGEGEKNISLELDFPRYCGMGFWGRKKR